MVSINFSTAVRQAQQAPTSYLSAVENFSATDYCTVELASAAKISLRPPIKGKGVIFDKTYRVTESVITNTKLLLFLETNLLF